MKQALIIFTELPIAGRTMTGLRPYFDKEQCAGLHEAFLRDIYDVVSNSLADLFVIYTGGDADEAESLKEIYQNATFMEQRGVTFEGRLYDAFSRVAELGYSKIILMEGTMPDFDGVFINRAFDTLNRKDFIFAPLDDGSYWMIGARIDGDVKGLKPLFMVDFTGDDVLESTLEIIPGWKSSEVIDEEKHVVSSIDELLIYRGEELKGCTREFLAANHVLSVIVPVLNLGAGVDRFLDELAKFRGRAEIILVDGGSDDGTYEALKEYADKYMNAIAISSAAGRAEQINTGAESANGDIIMFLEPDVVLPKDPMGDIMKVINEGGSAGYFPVDYPGGGLAMWYYKRLVNKAAQKGQIIASQGMFMKMDVFYNNGMMKDVPACEDVLFARDLKEAGVTFTPAASSICPSGSEITGGFFAKFKKAKQIQAERTLAFETGEVPAEKE